MSQATMHASITSRYHEKFPTSARLFERAQALFPNGVTHDSRRHKPFPVYVARAKGARKWDVDGNELIDYWVGHGSLLLGHSHPAVVEAVRRQAEWGTHPGACHERELLWGEWVQRLIRCAERMRFVSSGTEATLMALRLARIHTGRSKVLKFAGHFHGWHDFLMPGADPPFSSATEAGRSSSYEMPGVTGGVMGDLVIVPPNDLAAAERAMVQHQPACVILEATGGHFGVVPVGGAFLRGLRAMTERHGVVLIFDEVISGFRVHPGGAQGLYEITPDLTVLAKILAGGLPGGCVAGRADILDLLAFDNPRGVKMKHPGTFNANPLSAAAGSAALEIVATGNPCRRANASAASLRAQLNRLFDEKGVPWVAYGEFSGIKVLPDYEGPRPGLDAPDDYIPHGGSLEKLDAQFDPRLSHALRSALLLGGVDMSAWRGMTCAEHTEEDIGRTVEAFSSAIGMLRDDRLLA